MIKLAISGLGFWAVVISLLVYAVLSNPEVLAGLRMLLENWR